MVAPARLNPAHQSHVSSAFSVYAHKTTVKGENIPTSDSITARFKSKAPAAAACHSMAYSPDTCTTPRVGSPI
jgi:hypothetical protein